MIIGINEKMRSKGPVLLETRGSAAKSASYVFKMIDYLFSCLVTFVFNHN